MSVVLHNCDSSTSWTTNHASAFVADTGDYQEGSASLKFTATGGNDPYCYYDFGSPYKDLSSQDTLYMWYKSTSTNISGVGYISLWSDTSWTNGTWYKFSGYSLTWTQLALDLRNAYLHTGSGCNLSDIRRIRIDFIDSEIKDYWIDNIYGDLVDGDWIISDCDNHLVWETSNMGGYFQQDSEDYIYGDNSLYGTSTSTDPNAWFDQYYLDFSAQNTIGIYVKCPTGTLTDTFQLSLWSDRTNANGTWYEKTTMLYDDWTLVVFNLTDDYVSDTGAGVTLSDVQRIRFDFGQHSGVEVKIDKLFIGTFQQEADEDEALVLSEEASVYGLLEAESGETCILSDEVEALEVAYAYAEPTLTLTEESEIYAQETEDLDCDFRCIGQSLTDCTNKFASCIRVLTDFANKIKFFIRNLTDVTNDVRTMKESLANVTNDFRMILSWQRAADGGPVSRGKSYVKVYINSVEQTDVDIDSLSITKSYNVPATASFDLARAYDSTVPTLGHTAEIKYDDFVIFSGYVTSTSPTDSPDSIKVNCQDKMWKLEETSVNFNVGRPSGETEQTTRYATINYALTYGCSWSTSIGLFIPESMGCFTSLPNAITNLIQETGNYAWFVDENNNKRLVHLGSGNIVELQAQSLNENLNLYHVLSHNIGSSIEGLINQYLVITGNIVSKQGVKKPIDSKASSTQEEPIAESYAIQRIWCYPDWSVGYEDLASVDGKRDGYNSHPPEDDGKYNRVFKCYKFTPLNYEIYNEQGFEPYIIVYYTGDDFNSSRDSDYNIPSVDPIYQEYEDGGRKYTSGFTFDLKKGTLELSQPHYTVEKNHETGALVEYTRMSVRLICWVKTLSTEVPVYWGSSDETTSLPANYEQLASDYEYPYCFLTNKIGDYSTLKRGMLELSGYSVQSFYRTWDSTLKRYRTISGWNDIPFAYDKAKWELSKTAYIKYKGTIKITLDTLCYYNIDLSKRIYIEGVTESALNVTSIHYNLSDFTVELSLESFASYTRTVSYPNHNVQ